MIVKINGWVFGGKFEKGESPEECIRREVLEETGIVVESLNLRGIITYDDKNKDTEYMYLFTCNQFRGELIECIEGDLEWIEKEKVIELDTWEGDKIFLKKIQKKGPFFTMKFQYNGEKLIDYKIEEYE